MPQESTEAAEPQPVLSPLTAAAVFLVLTIEPGGEDAVRDLLGDVTALQRSVGFRTPGGQRRFSRAQLDEFISSMQQDAPASHSSSGNAGARVA